MGFENQNNSVIELSTQTRTIPELLLARSNECGNHIALQNERESITYAALPSRVFAISRALIARGLCTGDRVGLWAPNSVEWVLVALGIQCAGGVLVPINTRMKGKEAADILERSGARFLFVVDRFLGTDYPALLDGMTLDTLAYRIVLGGECDNPDSLPRLIEQGQDVSHKLVMERAASLRADDLSDLLFTSGTTGKPKGVMSAHGQTLRAFSEFSRILGLKPEDRYLVVNPFFHCFGYKAGWLACLISGATILPHAVFNAEEIFDRVESERVTVLPGPPALYLSMLEHPRLESADLSSLRIAVTGASSIPPSLIERIRQDLGCDRVTTAYGLTECGGLATICDPDESSETIAGTCGKAIPGTELCIMGEGDEVVAPGTTGEICLRGFHVMQGYFNNPEATSEAIDDTGWLHTGDVGHLDPKGNLVITDRLKDMFIVGGFNCYPAEIEAALFEHPDIAQVAVVGIPDERMGEVGCACVVLKRGRKQSEESLVRWSRTQMANYKVPRRVEFYEDLPKNASNKVDKVQLRQSLA